MRKMIVAVLLFSAARCGAIMISYEMPAVSIDTSKIRDDAVTTSKVLNQAITLPKLAATAGTIGQVLTQTDAAGTMGWTSVPPDAIQVNLLYSPGFPRLIQATSLSPTNHLATVARVFPFVLYSSITVNSIHVAVGVAQLADCFILGFFDSTGAQVLKTGAISSVDGSSITVVTSGTTPAFPYTFAPGNYYAASTNNNVVSALNALQVWTNYGTQPFTMQLPRWGTVPATNGAMPDSIDPTNITQTTGLWMVFITLSNVVN